MKKSSFIKYFSLLIILLIAWLSFFTTFWASIFMQDVKLVYKLSTNIYPNSDELNKSLFVYKSSSDLSNAYFQSSCKTETKFITKKDDLYLFELSVLDKNCSNNIFFLKSSLGILNETEVNLISDSKIYSLLLDYSSKELINISNSASKKSNWLKIFTTYKNNLLNDKYNFSTKKRIYEELIYKWGIVKTILEKRELKYSIPVPWYKLPTKNLSKIPNALRPYRSNITDWVHHSWDVNAPFWTKVVALDDGIIIRLVKDWDKTDFSNLRQWKNLSNEDKMRNLDILRWNQIWIKTMKWEVVMYAHLDKIIDSLKEWAMISKGDYVWNIWITWVPDDGYTDYHLDVSITENSYNLWKVGSYDTVDYMSWSWKFKWKSADYIINHQNDVFE